MQTIDRRHQICSASMSDANEVIALGIPFSASSRRTGVPHKLLTTSTPPIVTDRGPPRDASAPFSFGLCVVTTTGGAERVRSSLGSSAERSAWRAQGRRTQISSERYTPVG